MLIISLSLFGICGCESKESLPSYEQITADQAKNIMDNEKNYIIVDARTPEEFKEGHIPNSINIDYEETKEKSADFLPDKNQLILIYCRSGRRSKIAAETLVSLGYTNIKEFGGIIDWPYDIVK